MSTQFFDETLKLVVLDKEYKMSKARALVNKLKRRKKYLNRNRGLRTQDKIDKKDEKLQDSPKAYKLLEGIKRRLDKKFGQQLEPSPDKTSNEKLVLADLTDDTLGNLSMQLSSGMARFAGLKSGDIVTVLAGSLKGQQLSVTGVNFSTDVVSLEYAAGITGTESAVAVKLQLSGVKKSYV